MIPVDAFIVVEFDVAARKIRKGYLKEFNERRKEEFKEGKYNPMMILLGVFETAVEANECIEQHEDIDRLIQAIVNGNDPFA